MTERTGDSHAAMPPEGGRKLTSEEASFLLDYLSRTPNVVVVGSEAANTAAPRDAARRPPAETKA